MKAHVAQLAEANDLRSLKCEFESHCGHQKENTVKVQIPHVVHQEIDSEDFKKLCMDKFCPKTAPIYKIGDVLYKELGILKMISAITIVGIRPVSAGWLYDYVYARPSDTELNQASGLESDFKIVP